MATVEFATLDGVTLQDLSTNPDIMVTDIVGLSGLPAIRGSDGVTDIPLADGAIEPPNQYFGARYSTWDIVVTGATTAAARATYTTIMKTLGLAVRQQKQLRWRWLGDTLALQADVRISGMTGPKGGAGVAGPTISFQVIFRHADPTNYDQTLISPTAVTGTGTLTVSCTNNGDAYAWPGFVVIGPVTGMTITNNTTGLKLDFTGYAIVATHTVTIVSTPGKRTANESTAGNILPKLVSTTQWPALSPGATETYTMAGTARTVATSFAVTYRSAYFS